MISFIQRSPKCNVALEFLTSKIYFEEACNLITVEDKTNLIPFNNYGFFYSRNTVLPKGIEDVLATPAVMALYGYFEWHHFDRKKSQAHEKNKCEPLQPDKAVINWKMTMDCLYLAALGYFAGAVVLFIEMKMKFKVV